MKFFSAYGPKPSAAGKGRQGDFGPSRTQQQFKEENDPNRLMAVYMRNPDMRVFNQRPGEPTFADLTSLPSYQEALDKVIAAEAAFSSLPAVVRKRFRNSPEDLLNFVAQPENYDEAVKLGLLDPTKVDARKAAAAPPAANTPAEPLPLAPQGPQVKGA